MEESSARPLDSAASKRPFTADQRAVLEGPTRRIDPVPAVTEWKDRARPAARGGTKRPRWLVPLAASGGLLGLLTVVLIFAWGSAKKPASGQSSPDWPKAITNSIGMKLVLVEPGTFLMGSPPNEADDSNNEHQHEVEITQPFYAGIYPVTQEQYQRSWAEPQPVLVHGGGKDKVNGMDTRQFPVESCHWDDAVEFCRRLSELPEEKANERLYRLPTEAEWEYVCRGGPFFKKPSPPFYFGNSLSSTQANFDGNYPYGGAAKGTIPRTHLPRSAPTLPTLSASTISTATSGNGAPTGMTRITTSEAPSKTRRGRKTASAVFCAGVPGTQRRGLPRRLPRRLAPGDRYRYVGFRVVLVAGART